MTKAIGMLDELCGKHDKLFIDFFNELSSPPFAGCHVFAGPYTIKNEVPSLYIPGVVGLRASESRIQPRKPSPEMGMRN